MTLFALVVWMAAQIEIGSIVGQVVDPSGAVVSSARVTLSDETAGFERVATTNAEGAFRFRNLPFGLYAIHVDAEGFRSVTREIAVRSNFATNAELTLEMAGPDEELTVRATSPLVDPRATSGSTRIDETFLDSLPGWRPGAELQALVATAPGWSTEDNGLLHARGVDDGFLLVLGGMPLVDRVDTLFSSSIDVEAIESLEILDGHLPVEYGYASGGVIRAVPKSGLDDAWGGSFTARGGSFSTGGAAASAAGSLAEEAGLFLAASVEGSGERYLDPVDPENFNNRGTAWQLTLRADWQASERDLLVADLSAHGSGFRVTNTLGQEIAGQRQRQELADNHQSVLWQRSWSSSTVTDLGWYRRSFGARLLASENDTPLSASQDRGHVRQGLLWNATHVVASHLLKGGADLQRVAIRERFGFAVTDPELGEESGLSEEVLELEQPFAFDDSVSRSQLGLFLQDTFTLLDSLTINAGVRFDHTSVLVRDSQWSPRVGAVYRLSATDTAIRASYNRLFMPPQVENLLLSSSPEAHALSPFATEESEGGAEVPPERQHAFELGVSQPFGDFVALDVSYWRRSVRNNADPNVFLGTTVIFPNSVAEGTASGVSARLEIPTRKGISGFLSYSNSLVYQTGPINGGLFLEEEVIEIAPGTRFVPDHDQRNVGVFGLSYSHRGSGFQAAVYGRHESGTPLEVEEAELSEVMDRRGAELVDLERGRVKPRTLFDVVVGIELLRGRRVAMDVTLDVRNVTNERFAYNFSNPFSGTHFGHPRLFGARVRLVF